jgi:Arc/MetJ-type ribon-helix-helix transcriptional regulator
LLEIHDAYLLSCMRETIHIRMPDQLVDALASAAARRFQSVSEYARQALLDRLRQDGLDPARGDDEQKAA